MFVRCVQIHEQFEDFVHNFKRSCVRAVYLVDNNNDLVSEFECALQNETRLRHRSLKGINKQKNAVNHFQNTLNFSAEVRVTRGVDYVYFYIFVMNGGVLCKNGYSALSFEVVGVHNSFRNRLIFSENTALFKHLVNKRGLSVVNVRYNRNVSQIFSYHKTHSPRFVPYRRRTVFSVCNRIKYPFALYTYFMTFRQNSQKSRRIFVNCYFSPLFFILSVYFFGGLC